MCMPGRCMCSQGFYRHNGQCVPASECPVKDQYQTSWFIKQNHIIDFESVCEK